MFAVIRVIGQCERRSAFLAHPGTPIGQVVSIKSDAQQIARKKAILRGLNSDHANDEAVYRSKNPAVPQSFSDQNRGKNGEQTRNIIEMKHIFEITRPCNPFASSVRRSGLGTILYSRAGKVQLRRNWDWAKVILSRLSQIRA